MNRRPSWLSFLILFLFLVGFLRTMSCTFLFCHRLFSEKNYQLRETLLVSLCLLCCRGRSCTIDCILNIFYHHLVCLVMQSMHLEFTYWLWPLQILLALHCFNGAGYIINNAKLKPELWTLHSCSCYLLQCFLYRHAAVVIQKSNINNIQSHCILKQCMEDVNVN